MGSGVWILVGVVVLVAAFALLRRARDGRLATPGAAPEAPGGADATTATTDDRTRLTAEDVGAPLGAYATFVQFSSAFCAPCRTTRTLLDDVLARHDGVEHVEVDAESRLDLVRALGVMRTPTTVVLDAAGVEVTRTSGVPRRDELDRLATALVSRDAVS